MLEDFLRQFNIESSQISSKILNFIGLPIEQFILICSALALVLQLLLLRSERKRLSSFTDTSLGTSADIFEPSKEKSKYVADEDQDVVIHKEVKEKPVSSVSYQAGLKASRGSILSRVSNWFGSNKTINKDNARELEDILISSDLGVQTSKKIIENVLENFKPEDDIRESIKTNLVTILSGSKPAEIILDKQIPLIVLIVGVNGAGKTTTIAKLSKKFKTEGRKVLVAAADTFRAAAVEQLKHWADKIGIDIEYKIGENIKPATIVFDAVSRLKKEGHDILIVDTAGRLHNRVNLMNELESINKIINKDFPGAPHETILVLDGSSGQNALQQAREFHQKVDLSGIIITKLDGTSKGGIVVAIKDELNVPIRYVGLGEGELDLKVFKPKEYVDAIFGDSELKIDSSYQAKSTEEESSIQKETAQKELEAPVTETPTKRRVVRRRKA